MNKREKSQRSADNDLSLANLQARAGAPGKSSRTGHFGQRAHAGRRPNEGATAPVQRRAAGSVDLEASAAALGTFVTQMKGAGGAGTSQVHEAAAHGVQDSGGSLPHLAQIQRSFGSHDVSGIQSHVGGKAAEANQAMGAEAYASGNHVAFRDTDPTMHTAAHEAAHIVQQRAGVSLKDGVGTSGDAYERHADAVADKVTRSESAESLLSTMSGGDSAAQAGSVQRLQDESNEVTVNRGELTTLGEGSDAQTKYIHWPNTDASGVTLGKGYDIGSRSAQQVIDELVAAGMDEAQATKVSKGAGLKGQAANRFVQQNKSAVGEIASSVQYALLSTMLTEYTARAKSTATNTTADGTRNAAGREKKEGKEAGTYVMSTEEWDGMHPAMHEFLTDLIYQGGYYGWDRVAKINEAIKANNGDHLEQFKAVRELFTNGYMDKYAGAIGEGKGRSGAKGNWYGQQIDYEGGYRRNSIRLAYLNHIITALEAGKTVVVSSGGGGADAGAGDGAQAEVTTAPELPPPAPQPQASAQGEPQAQAAAPSTGGQHVVASGETLNQLARKFNTTVDELVAANASKLKTWGTVQGFNAGETITIPGGQAETEQPAATAAQPSATAREESYVVQKGESLGILAAKFGVSEAALKSANADQLQTWGSVQGFFAGATIVVPGTSGGEPATAEAQEEQETQAGSEDAKAEAEQAQSQTPTKTATGGTAQGASSTNYLSEEIKENVGAGGANKARDVRIVQQNLINLGYLSDGPEVKAALEAEDDAVISAMTATIAAIKQYQKFGLGSGSPDGRIDVGGNTWKNMTGRLEVIQEYASHEIKTEPISSVLSPSEWISQFPSDKAKNGSGRGLREDEKAYAGKNNNVCCWDAAQAMVKQKGGSLKHEVSSRIPTLLQQDGATNVLNGQAQLGVKYIDKELLSGRPVMIGVDDGRVAAYNADATTEHFIVIVGKVADGGQVSYLYYDPGTRWGSKGYSGNNQMALGDDSSLSGKSYSGTKDYRMSQVRQNS